MNTNKTKKTTILQVSYRNVGGKGTQTLAVKQKFKKGFELKDIIIGKLQQEYWGPRGVKLTRSNIRLLGCCDSGDALEIDDDELLPRTTATTEQEEKKDDDSVLAEDDKSKERKKLLSFITHVVAVEYFETLPEDLIRRVTLYEAIPRNCTYSHPDYAVTDYTDKSPLWCATFRANEQKMPWYERKGNQIKFCGVSLAPVDRKAETESSRATGNPHEIKESEKKGVTFMTLEEYDSVAKNERDPTFGILRTEVSTVPNDLGIKLMKKSVLTNGKEKDKEWKKKNPILATTRTIFHQFKIQKNVNLAQYGVAVVYDNQSEDHVTMVRLQMGYLDREWAFDYDLDSVIPKDCSDMIKECGTDKEKRNLILKDQVFNTLGEEPEFECRDEFVSEKGNMVLPKVASLFTLHNLRLEASAEPSPPEGDNSSDKDCKLMYEGALKLYNLHLGDWNLTSSLEALEKVNYKVEDLETSLREKLLETLEENPDVKLARMELDETDSDDGVINVLDEMEAILERHAGGKTSDTLYNN